jgi:hypothetical protein
MKRITPITLWTSAAIVATGAFGFIVGSRQTVTDESEPAVATPVGQSDENRIVRVERLTREYNEDGELVRESTEITYMSAGVEG